MVDKDSKEELEFKREEQEEAIEEDKIDNEELGNSNSSSDEIDSEFTITQEQFAQLEEELAKEKEEKDKYIDRLQRLQAEFSNYRKRVIKDKERLADQATKSLIVELLPIVDNFERALITAQKDEEASLLEGVELIHRQIINLLKKQGVTEVKTVGEEFDPNVHEAVMKELSEEYDSDIVTEELQKGYLFNEDIIRAAMVKVSE